jgi:endonuclease YncB( thermonuclease family)
MSAFLLPRGSDGGSMGGMRNSILIFALALLPFAAPASAQSYRGEAIALEGDSILVSAMGHSDIVLRILGIDAPGLDAADGDGWFARAALDDILGGGGGVVTCQQFGEAQGQPLAYCTLDSGRQRDLGLAMVASGWAVPLRRYLRENANQIRSDLATSYEQAERAARRARKGRWARMPGR